MTDETNWQNIESAPRNGTVVIGWWPSAVTDDGYKQPVKFDALKGWIVDWDHEEVSPEMWLPMPKSPDGSRRAIR